MVLSLKVPHQKGEVMLRKLNDKDDNWSPEEMLKEQLAFAKDNGTLEGELVHIVHYKTDKPYYAHELAEIYFRQQEKKRRIERLNSDESKSKKLAFKGERLEKLKQDRKNGMSIRKLADKYNCSTRTIQKYLKVE